MFACSRGARSSCWYDVRRGSRDRKFKKGEPFGVQYRVSGPSAATGHGKEPYPLSRTDLNGTELLMITNGRDFAIASQEQINQTFIHLRFSGLIIKRYSDYHKGVTSKP